MHRVGSLASVETGQATGIPNCRPPKVTFCAVLGPEVVGGVGTVEVVVLVDGSVDVVVLVLELVLVLVGVETLGPDPPPHAASSNAPAAMTATATVVFQSLCEVTARRLAIRGIGLPNPRQLPPIEPTRPDGTDIHPSIADLKNDVDAERYHPIRGAMRPTRHPRRAWFRTTSTPPGDLQCAPNAEENRVPDGMTGSPALSGTTGARGGSGAVARIPRAFALQQGKGRDAPVG